MATAKKKRYFVYKGKKYSVKSKASNKDIYQSLIKIINRLLKKRKRAKNNSKNKESKFNTKEPMISSSRFPEEKPLTKEQLERYKHFSDIQKEKVLEEKTRLLKAAKEAVSSENKKLHLLQASSPASADPSTAAKKMVERIKYSEAKIGELQKQEKLLVDNIEVLEERSNNILKELKGKKLEDFVTESPHKVLVRLHKNIFGASSTTGSKTDGSKGKKSKKEILEEISIKYPNLYDYINKHVDENPEDVLTDFVNEQKGDGLTNGKAGLYNFEVAELMKKYATKGFLGAYSIDQMSKIHPDNRDKISFILNVQPSYIKYGHFVAVMISKDSNTLEYYNPLGDPPSKRFVKQIKKILAKMKFRKAVQFKINRIRFQSYKSSNCGYFSIKFLVNRYDGQSFREASGYDHFINIMHSEQEIRKFKKHVQNFGYL